jgi:hypothetical protein
MIKTALSAIGIMLLTSIHHAYGAAIYGTPWRHHVVHIARWVIVGLVVTLTAFRKWSRTIIGQTAFWLFIILVVVFPIGWVGFFEGGYGHLLKNTLYFLSAPPALIRTLFPPLIYEMPNSLFFETIGVLQFIVAVLLVSLTLGILRNRRRVQSKPKVRIPI